MSERICANTTVAEMPAPSTSRVSGPTPPSAAPARPPPGPAAPRFRENHPAQHVEGLRELLDLVDQARVENLVVAHQRERSARQDADVTHRVVDRVGGRGEPGEPGPAAPVERGDPADLLAAGQVAAKGIDRRLRLPALRRAFSIGLASFAMSPSATSCRTSLAVARMPAASRRARRTGCVGTTATTAIPTSPPTRASTIRSNPAASPGGSSVATSTADVPACIEKIGPDPISTAVPIASVTTSVICHAPVPISEISRSRYRSRR